MKTTKNVKANTTAKKSTGAEKSTKTKPIAEKVETTKKSTTKAKAESETNKISAMVATLKSALPKITDKKLKAEVENSLKVVKSAKAEDLAALLKRVIDSGKPVVENEVKKTIKKSSKTTEKAETAKTTTKAKTNKSEPKEESVKSIKSTGDIIAPLATIFPETINTQIDGESVTLRIAKDDEFLTLEDIKDAIESGKTFVVACYWTARHIKEFNYAYTFAVDKAPKKFENDLDLAQGITISEMNHKFFALSTETEAMYVFYEDDFTPIEDTNPYNGEKYKVRVSSGMEFAVYVEAEKPKAKAKK